MNIKNIHKILLVNKNKKLPYFYLHKFYIKLNLILYYIYPNQFLSLEILCRKVTKYQTPTVVVNSPIHNLVCLRLRSNPMGL